MKKLGGEVVEPRKRQPNKTSLTQEGGGVELPRKRGPKTISNAKLQFTRDALVRFLEPNWPELELLCGPPPDLGVLHQKLAVFARGSLDGMQMIDNHTPQLQAAGAAAQAKIDELAGHFNTSREAVVGFLKILKEDEVPVE
jgi:hypothetical protein